MKRFRPASLAKVSASPGNPLAAVADTGGQVGDGRGQVGDGPVPEARCRRRVGVVHGDGEAAGLLGEARPAQLRRDVLAARAHDAADLVVGQRLAVGDRLRGQRERRAASAGSRRGCSRNAMDLSFHRVVSSAAGSAREPGCRTSAHRRVPARRRRGTAPRNPGRAAAAAARTRSSEFPSARMLLRRFRRTSMYGTVRASGSAARIAAFIASTQVAVEAWFRTTAVR